MTLRPPFAPLPWRWTWTIVPSVGAHSKPGFCECSVKVRSDMPFPAQRRKRIHGVMHLPKWGGRSCQGAPVRRRQSTASRNSRHDRLVSGAKTAIRAACREWLHFYFAKGPAKPTEQLSPAPIWMRFSGFASGKPTPDTDTIRMFRECLTEA